MRFLGVLIFIIGIILFILNVTGVNPTIPFAGFITMIIGGVVYSAGKQRKKKKQQKSLNIYKSDIQDSNISIKSDSKYKNEWSAEKSKFMKIMPYIDRMISKGEANDDIIEMGLKQGIEIETMIGYLRGKGRDI